MEHNQYYCGGCNHKFTSSGHFSHFHKTQNLTCLAYLDQQHQAQLRALLGPWFILGDATCWKRYEAKNCKIP
ncbi:hypothetical protein BOTBODRAFT_174433 [Botryobasidium botryosum FD-172 SS1]|uniref:Uncharacterized protein n=1 Tax=Botryobasidium botryosum (strain FD-172 SS1) TaxID=930990 RepID=A0A067MSV4_BOTB1|nr:hypothetical protein BOTBODRAFT_174433 [Botryobasidium botryosum FD-172 SS1]